jgi:hypothetical protein
VVRRDARCASEGESGAGLGGEWEKDFGMDRALQKADDPRGRAGEVGSGVGDQGKRDRSGTVEKRRGKEQDD